MKSNQMQNFQSIVKEEPMDSFMNEPVHVGTSNDTPKTVGEYSKIPLVIVPQGERYSMYDVLEQFKPTAIILYNLSLLTTRQIEIFHATHSEHYRQIYCLQYKDSTEESRYLDSVSKENECFDFLFKENEALLISREYDTSREMPRKLASTRDMRNRVDEDEDEDQRPKIIVDMREFNSELPTVLYKQGFDVTAATLEVGDYILSPNIAVERKALDDLTQSLQSSRVFKQSEQMLRHYKNAILLIESNQKFETKLVNGGPFQLTEPEPDLEKAISLKSDELGESSQQDPNQASTSSASESTTTTSKKVRPNAVMLRHLTAALPRMGKGDVEKIMTGGKIHNLYELFTRNPQQLQSAVGPPHADRLSLLATFDFSSGS
ncbi:hypothetical protein WR25_12140 [Diploscapter pachys]|uniref:ERCC4 domain-containing protein n=1 Tax=Diploscapter pachys TaxID=2018661 RepID=A0A2A2KMW7_9BILA|nr:hypothetical protein WR25_12140 [Diploscapter pachys]